MKVELNSVLNRPKVQKALKSKNSSSVRVIIGSLLNQAETVDSKPVPIRSFSDENDHFLLELALSANAAVIVTGDQEILKAKKVRGIENLNWQEFCDKLRSSDLNAPGTTGLPRPKAAFSGSRLQRRRGPGPHQATARPA